MVKERIVRGFDKTNEIATDEGICVKMAMELFMMDVLDIVRQGGRLWGHHLGFHGSVIERQLERLGMYALHQTWVDILREGVCLMDPVIGKYVRQCCDETSNETSSALSFPELLKCLLPEYYTSQTRAATAIENAAACLQIGRCIRELVLPPCRRQGGRHTYTRVYPTCMRDNGEWTEECTGCRCTRR